MQRSGATSQQCGEDDFLFIGIDLGTSGCRGIAIDGCRQVHGRSHVPLPPGDRQTPEIWWDAVQEVAASVLAQVRGRHVRALSVDGTSGTVLLTDPDGHPVSPMLLYNDGRAVAEAAAIERLAPRESAAHGAGSGLAKLLWLMPRYRDKEPRVHTEADWIVGMLSGRWDSCDINNAMKLGCDPTARRWPAWLDELGVPPTVLPKLVEPGHPIGPLRADLAKQWNLPLAPQVCAGTTDSTAAFLATGASQPGEAVTSLGSTLVLKVIAEEPVFAPEYGVYSQPFGKLWLVGGASNSGGAVLRRFFSDEQMATLSSALKPEQPTGLDFYPLLAPGERFPTNDPALPPRLTPRPRNDVEFFQGLLEGIARIEQQGYALLQRLGAPYPISVRTTGGGAVNPAWTMIRARLLNVPMQKAQHDEAAFGTALLALRCDKNNENRACPD